jgi:site-specific DNA-methyltransferase (adenine-specific)
MTLHTGNSLEIMPAMEPESVDSIVTDPPYGLVFMGKDWDHGVPGVAFWQAALRVAKPGAHLLAFGGTRTFHRLAVAIEDAGWEIRDTVMWCYGSGFPKSHDVSKAIDKAAGAERAVVGLRFDADGRTRAAEPHGKTVYQRNGIYGQDDRDAMSIKAATLPATPDAERWAGWGTALKPAWEPVIVARKPFAGTVAANVLAWGTGAINVDKCRIPTNGDEVNARAHKEALNNGAGYDGGWRQENRQWNGTSGRWPPNLAHDGSDEVLARFPVTTSGVAVRRHIGVSSRGIYSPGKNGGKGDPMEDMAYTDTGSASRFFPAFAHDAEDIEAARFMYCAKASRADRDDGLEGMEARIELIGAAGHKTNPMTGKPVVDIPRRNGHPCVKPTPLMRWLCRLVTPPGGIVFDPFMGSGSTGKAAVLEGFSFVGIEQDAEYVEIARRRIDAAVLPLFANPPLDSAQEALGDG